MVSGIFLSVLEAAKCFFVLFFSFQAIVLIKKGRVTGFFLFIWALIVFANSSGSGTQVASRLGKRTPAICFLSSSNLNCQKHAA